MMNLNGSLSLVSILAELKWQLNRNSTIRKLDKLKLTPMSCSTLSLMNKELLITIWEQVDF